MIKCYVCGANVYESNWKAHVARDKKKYGADIFLRLKKSRDEYYNRNKLIFSPVEVNQADIKLNEFT